MHHCWRKMKLKQRITFAFILTLTLILILSQTFFMVAGKLELPRDLDADWFGVQKDLTKGVRSKMNSLRGTLSKWSSDNGHLNVPRKDLDVSNYTSAYDQKSRDERDPLLNLTFKSFIDQKEANKIIQEHILKEDIFKLKVNIEKLLVAVDFIKETSKTGGLSVDQLKNVLSTYNFDNQRFLAQNGHNSIERLKQIKALERSVNLSEEELSKLHSIRPNTFYMHQNKKKSGRVLNLYEESANITGWQRFHSHISQYELYREGDPAIEEVLNDLRYQEIVDAIMRGGGTQLKLIFYLANGARVLFKPMRFPRTQETLPNHFYFSDYERHVSEIAAFNLDRIIGFHRCPPVAGRTINITRDIKVFAEHDLLKTFFVSPAGNICFHGVCDYYCDTGHAVCGNPELLEGSFAQYLPSSKRVDRKTWRHPWRRSYHKRKKSVWEEDNNYCASVRVQPPYDEGRRLLDLMDMAVFDFLIGNLDRHHYETLRVFGNYTAPLHLDNGRGFGKAFHDEISILAPVYQCCLMRYSTMQTLLKFDRGPEKLSDAMRKIGLQDLVTPVLLEQHLLALDRRVKIILKTVYRCIEKNGSTQRVVIDDGF